MATGFWGGVKQRIQRRLLAAGLVSDTYRMTTMMRIDRRGLRGQQQKTRTNCLLSTCSKYDLTHRHDDCGLRLLPLPLVIVGSRTRHLATG